MGLLTNDVTLKASGSGSSSKIGGDKSEEDDSPSLRPSSIPKDQTDGDSSFVTIYDNTLPTSSTTSGASSSVSFSTAKPSLPPTCTTDTSKILRLSSAASASSWNPGRDNSTTTPSSSSSLTRRKPSLEEAKRFGNRRRPHRLPDASQASGYRLARVGEMQDEQTGAPAEDYDVWRTPLRALDEYGLGISLYFRQLVVLSGLFFLCGLASVPSIWHNTTYGNNAGTDFFAIGSAAGAERKNLSFSYTAMTDLAVVILLVLFALVSRHVSDTISARVDEAQQTAQDYSVCVLNPPPELLDPNVYHAFFSNYGDVCGVTIALNNGGLLTAMAAKKEIETRLRESVEGERMLEAEAEGWGLRIDPQPVWKRVGAALGLYQDAIVLWRQREVLQERIKVAAETQVEHAKAKRVFVTFNTEMAQRMALQDMYAGIVQKALGGRIRVWSNPRAVFEGRVLLLEEACEPPEVIWENFQYRLWRRVLRFGISLVCSFFLLLASYFTLEYYSGTSKKGSILSALLISLINIMLPVIIKTFSVSVELPLSLSEQQSSILAKLVVARCVNTAVLFYAVTNYTEMFTDTTMASIMIILVTDAVLAPTLQALNLPQQLMQRFVAPRCKTQSAMNAHFSGLPWHLAERYTEISKTIFVSTFWSAILPAGLFVTSAALAVNYFADRYALFQIWKRPPPLSSRLVTLSRHVFSLTIFTHVIMAKTFFADWPFDDEKTKAECGLFFCRPIPAWTRSQRSSVGFYSILSVVIFCVIVQEAFWGPARTLVNATRRHFYVSGQGAAMTIQYRRVSGIFAFVPTLEVRDWGSHSEKWLAANLVNVPRYLVPLPKDLDVEENNLCAPKELVGVGIAEADLPKLFSTFQFYPSPSPTSAAAVADAKSAAILAAAVAADAAAAAPIAAESAEEAALEESGATAAAATAAAATAAAGGGLLGMLSDLMWPMEMKPVDTAAAGARAEAGGGGAAAAAAAGRGFSEAPLPEGWEKGVDEEGREVYFNVDTMESQRERPVAAAGWSPYTWWGYLNPWK